MSVYLLAFLDESCWLINHISRYSTEGTITEEGEDVPENYALSDLDKAYIMLSYPRLSPHADAQEWTIDKALHVAGVKGTARDTILSEKNPDDIRLVFILWNTQNQTWNLTPCIPLSFRGTNYLVYPYHNLVNKLFSNRDSNSIRPQLPVIWHDLAYYSYTLQNICICHTQTTPWSPETEPWINESRGPIMIS